MDGCGLIRVSHAVWSDGRNSCSFRGVDTKITCFCHGFFHGKGRVGRKVEYPGEGCLFLCPSDPAVAFPCFSCPRFRESRKRSCVMGFVLLESQLSNRPSELPGISKCLGRKKLQTCPVLKCQCLQLSTVVSFDRCAVIWRQ